MSDQLREWEWPVPTEVLAFGANGSGEPYGLWIGPHDAERFPEPIVQIGEIFEPDCMGLISSNLGSLLLEETVMGLVLSKQLDAVIKHFGLAADSLPTPPMVDGLLGVGNLSSAESAQAARSLSELERWANPNLDLRYRDPYEARLDVTALAKLLA